MTAIDPQIGYFIKSIINDEFALVAVVTFFLCEAIFNAFPIYRSRMKQLTSLIVGGFLGLFLIPDVPSLAFVQGFLAGGATTISVARFKGVRSSSSEEVQPRVRREKFESSEGDVPLVDDPVSDDVRL